MSTHTIFSPQFSFFGIRFHYAVRLVIELQSSLYQLVSSRCVSWATLNNTGLCVGFGMVTFTFFMGRLPGSAMLSHGVSLYGSTGETARLFHIPPAHTPLPGFIFLKL